MWPELDAGWSVAGIGDFNGDGIDDILLRNVDGTIVNWLGTENSQFVDNSGNLFTNIDSGWHVVGVGTFDCDGRADIS